MHYGEPIIRKAVPLALGLLSASNPQLPILDTLSKYSHDNDLQVALNAIFAMGLVGAGTNNARLAQMLRQLAGYYHKEPDCLFVVRIAQGLVHMGKGTISINPFFLDRQIMSRTAVAGLLATITAFIDAKSCKCLNDFEPYYETYRYIAVVLDRYHWFLYFLVTAMYPRFLITLNEELESFPVTVRVGQVYSINFMSIRLRSLTDIITIGRRCRRPSRQAKNNFRVPDTLDTSTAGNDGTCRVGYGGVHSFRACTRGSCHPSEKSGVREGGQDGSVDSFTICIILIHVLDVLVFAFSISLHR